MTRLCRGSTTTGLTGGNDLALDALDGKITRKLPVQLRVGDDVFGIHISDDVSR